MAKFGGNDERESTLNQLLVEMDGFDTTNKVIVMGATNRKEILDDALVRPGRFDREVEVSLPDLRGRVEIFRIHLKPLRLSPKHTMEEYARRLASLTPGFSGAEIANLCNEAAILSARHEKTEVEMIDFEISSERVIGGVERKGFVSGEERRTVAFHECGHAVVSWFLEGADPLLKVSIIPRSKGALGFAQYFTNESQLQTKDEILDRICFILGGRCSEKYFFNEVTTGAYDDLMKAYDLAYAMIAKYGMIPEIGNISYPDVKYIKPYGEEIESTIDSKICWVIGECMQKCKRIVEEHQDDIRRYVVRYLGWLRFCYKRRPSMLGPFRKSLGKDPFLPIRPLRSIWKLLIRSEWGHSVGYDKI
jgi:AFG3 family protein